MDLAMKINYLPALTFGFLHLNGADLEDQNIPVQTLSAPAPSKLPEGVTLKENVSFGDAGKIFQADDKRTQEGTSDFSAPNGGTYGWNNGQVVRTGMGLEMDRLMEQMQAKVTVVETREGSKVTEPLLFHYDMKDGEGSLSGQVIHAAKNSEITVVMDYVSGDSDQGFQGVSTRLLADEGATIHLVKIQLLGNGFLHFDDIGGVCDNGATIDLVQMEIGSSKSYSGAYINLLGDTSSFLNNLGYLGRGSQLIDNNCVAEVRGKKAKTVLNSKGVLTDQAKKIYRGSIDFRNGCKGSFGREMEEVLLLSEEVVNRTIPLILCQEEDINGDHGATIGRLSEEELFYMETRGVSREYAEKLIVASRLRSIAQKIPAKGLRRDTIRYIDRILGMENLEEEDQRA